MFRLARERAGVTKQLRPHHSLRDTNLTILGRTLPSFALQAHAGHASVTTTQGCVNRHEVVAAGYPDHLERSLLGERDTKRVYKTAESSSEAEPSKAQKRLG